MRLSALSLSAVLLCSSPMLAQHSSAGGGGSSSGSSSSASSGGGSHGGSSSFSGNSASSHVSSGGTFSHGSSSHSSNSVSGSAAPNSGVRGSQLHTSQSFREPNRGLQVKTTQPEKRTFFSFLRHPFRKPEPKPAVYLPRPICFRHPCPVCSAGQVRGRGSCGGAVVNNTDNFCPRWQVWSGGACLLQTRFLDDCTGLRLALDQQARRMQDGESAQQRACTTGLTQECSDLTGKAQSESNLYGSWQERYRQCQLRSYNAFPYGAYGYRGRWPGWLLDPSDFGADLQLEDFAKE